MRGFDPVRLRLAREAARLTRAELARLTGVSSSAYSQWERGKSSPRPDSLARCASFLQVDVADFFTLTEDEYFIGDLRTRRGLLQADLAELVEVSVPMVGLVERGEVGFGPALAKRWAEVLDYPVEVVNAAYHRTRERPPRVRP